MLPVKSGSRGAIFMRPWFWALVVAAAFAVPLLGQALRPAPKPLPVIGTLPAFQLTDAHGKPFGSEQLRGKVWLASFVFTRCPVVCPGTMKTLQRVQKRGRGLFPDFRLVAFTVDPAYDTPEVLAAFGARHKTSRNFFHLLTGPVEAVHHTVEKGLKIAMQPGSADYENQPEAAVHGTHFVLVDREGRIRGFYDSTAPDVVGSVLRDASLLLNRGGNFGAGAERALIRTA